MTPATNGPRVLDLSESIAGQYCARMFADYGAEVLLIEPPAGSAIRAIGPFDGDMSLLFFHLNLGKASITLDLAGAAGRARLLRLAQAADVVITGDDTHHAALREANPVAVVSLITPFGTSGPLAAWHGSEMIYQALSGMMHNNGELGRPPLYGTGHRASYAAGVAAHIAISAALYARDRHGQGQQVEIEIAETAASMCFPYLTQYIYNGFVHSRGDQVQPICPVQCRDGWVCIWIYNHRFAAACTVLGVPELIDDPRFAKPQTRLQNWSAFVRIMGAHLADRESEALVALLQDSQVIAAKSYRPTELLRNEHLHARGYWRSVQTARGPRRVLGPQFRMTRSAFAIRGGAPALGDANATIDWRGSAPSRPGRDPAGQTSGPFMGLRVLDVTTAWAGPMAGRVLGFLGAEVIHVEAATRVNSWRVHKEGVNPQYYPAGKPGERPYNRAFLFNSQNINKLSLTLDMKKPESAPVLLRLALTADVVICNFRPGTLEKLGIGYRALADRKPGIIVAEMPAFGLSGPLSGHAALGPTMEMAAGMSSMIGYSDDGPVTTGPSYLDPIGGFHGAAAVITALRHRQATGEGQHVEIPQVEAAMQFIGEMLLHADVTGKDPPRQGNYVDWAAPHDAFRCAGADQWVAVAVTSDAQFVALCNEIGQPGLAADPRFATSAVRIRNQDLLHAPIAQWTGERSKHDAAARLQAAGVPAAPVHNPRDSAESAYLAHVGFFTPLDHPEAGSHAYPGLPFRLSLNPGTQRSAAPGFGQHSRHVLETLLALPEQELQRLQDSGALSDIPLQ